MPVKDRALGHRPNADAHTHHSGAFTARSQAARRLIAILLLAIAALDLTRCGLVLATARHLAFAAGLVAAGLVAAAISIWIARACLARPRRPSWAALLIAAASAPQAAVSGFGAPYTVPDSATAAVGILLAVTVLATVGPTSTQRPVVYQCANHKEASR